MRLFKIISLVFILSTILVTSFADDDLEDATKDDGDEVQEAVGDILLPKGLTVEDYLLGHARSMTVPNLWKNGEVPYEFDSSVDDTLRSTVLQAFEVWENGSCIKFKEGCDSYACIQVTTTNPMHQEAACYSAMGALAGSQPLNLGSGCESLKVAIHEIGHALGFDHEMHRVDRDKFMHINEHHAEKPIEMWFGKYVRKDGTDYDMSSIMQYEASMASTNQKSNSMASLNPHYQHLIGRSKLPSFRDFYRLNALYSCSSDCPNDHHPCANGGFLSPYKGDGEDCFCVCPPRIEGDSCDIIPEGYDYYEVPSCSQNVTEETVIETPNYPERNEPPEQCSWWMQAPEGKKVQVEFEDFSFTEHYNCRPDKVELRYKEDL